MKDAFNRGADVAGADRLVVINRTSIINPMPLSYRDKILRIPGVKAVTHNNWFGGIYQDEKNFFPQFVIDPENQRTGFSRTDGSRRSVESFREGSSGRHRRRQERPNAFTGKSAIASPSRPPSMAAATWEFNLDGIYHGKRPQDDETQFWFQWDYFEENVPETDKGQRRLVRSPHRQSR